MNWPPWEPEPFWGDASPISCTPIRVVQGPIATLPVGPAPMISSPSWAIQAGNNRLNTSAIPGGPAGTPNNSSSFGGGGSFRGGGGFSSGGGSASGGGGGTGGNGGATGSAGSNSQPEITNATLLGSGLEWATPGGRWLNIFKTKGAWKATKELFGIFKKTIKGQPRSNLNGRFVSRTKQFSKKVINGTINSAKFSYGFGLGVISANTVGWEPIINDKTVQAGYNFGLIYGNMPW